MSLYFVSYIWFFTSQSTIFQLCWDRSSWIEPVLSKYKYVLLKDTTVTPGKLEPTTLRFGVKHSTTVLAKLRVEEKQ